MKKNYFFIAALAIGMMSSCSNNEILEEVELPSLPDQVIDEGTTRMPIELGISDPSFTVSTRGTGTVGDLRGEATNVWNGQPLGLFMVERNTMIEATEGEGENATPIFNGMTFKAPVGTNSGNIIMYHATENVKYYPLTKAYDFYGYHLGEMTAPTGVTYADDLSNATVAATINGTQDIMAGKAELTEDQQTTLGNDSYKAYSSWSARKGIKPYLNFKHMLSRLVFNVKAGEAKAAKDSYVDSGADNTTTFPKVDNGTGTMIDQAVYITAITVKDQSDNVLLTFTPGSDTAKAKIELTDKTTATGEDKADFVLMERATIEDDEEEDEEGEGEGEGEDVEPGDGDINLSTLAELVTLTATCPEEFGENAEATRVGESMMIFPGQTSFVVDITVKQYVQTFDDPAIDGASDLDEYAWKVQTMSTTVKAPTSTVDANAFAQGKSYNVNVTVFGYQRIEVEAVLEGWIAGGDVDVNPEDDAFNQQ